MRLMAWVTPIDAFLAGAVIGAIGVPLLKKGLQGLSKMGLKTNGQLDRKTGKGTFWWTGIVQEAGERHKRRIEERALKAACHGAGSCGGILFGAGSEF